jgi:hypothetical protein
LHLVSFVKIEKSSPGFKVRPPPEKACNRIFKFQMKICFRKMIFTEVAKLLFIFPQTVAAAGTDSRENY